MMYTNNNLMPFATSIPLLSSNPLATPLLHLHPIPQSQTATSSHTPSLSSAPPFQQQYQHPYSCESQSQILSQDEWNLILSLRMMKNLSVLPPFQSSSSSVYQHTGDTTSYQATSSSYQTGYQIQSPAFYETTAALTAPSYHDEASSIHPYTSSTTGLKQLLCAEKIQGTTVQVQSLLTTAIPSSSPILTTAIPSSSPILITTAPSSSSSFTTVPSSPPPSSIVAVRQTLEQTPLSPRTQPGHQNDSYSPLPQLQSHSPGSPPPAIISPVQQQKSPNQYSSTSRRRRQSADSHAPKTYQYDPLITGPTVQLLDPTKPYKIGDKIKVGGRTLQSDISSMKYWLEDDITITETINGGHILNMTGYSYLRKNVGKNFTTWECEHRRKNHCSSVVIRSSDQAVKNYFRIYSIQGEHNHESTPDNIEIRKFKQRVRDRCRQELSCPRTIYEDELMKGKYTSKMLAFLPTFYNMQAQLYRIRQDYLPTSPTDPNFVLHPGFMSTDQGERFLLYDSNAVQVPYATAPFEVGRLLIYASDLQLVLLSKSKRIGSDGTFETAPQISQQNYIIIGEVEEKHAAPLVLCLCEHKNYETYQLIIQVLKTAIVNLKLDWNPIYWMSDYEDALTKAIKQELPNAELLGCTFHYCQSIYRNIQSKGLQDVYQNVDVIRQILRCIMALAFVPHDQIRTAYYDIIKPQLNDVPAKPTFIRQNLRAFFKYYESYWLTKIDKFCVFDQPTRTNNGLEGYNNKMNAQLSAHPHFYRLIVWFEKEELLVQQLLVKVNADKPVHKRKQSAITILINDSLQSLWDSYNAGKISTEELLLESSKWVAKKAI